MNHLFQKDSRRLAPPPTIANGWQWWANTLLAQSIVRFGHAAQPVADAERQLFRPVTPAPVTGRRSRQVHPPFGAYTKHILKRKDYRIRD